MDSEDDLQVQIQAILNDASLVAPPIPQVPNLGPHLPTKTRLRSAQNFISSLEYNYTGTLYFDVSKNRSFKRIVSTAKEIIVDSLPIQCLEAVFLAAYLTAEMQDVDRFPISFKSIVDGQTFRHIILAVRHKQIWGALGLSRSDKLMFKELKFKSLWEMILHFQKSYATCHHELIKFYIGFPITHDIHSTKKVEWRMLNISINEHEDSKIEIQVNRFAKDAVNIKEHYHRNGTLPSSFEVAFHFHKPSKKIQSPQKSTMTKSASLSGLTIAPAAIKPIIAKSSPSRKKSGSKTPKKAVKKDSLPKIQTAAKPKTQFSCLIPHPNVVQFEVDTSVGKTHSCNFLIESTFNDKVNIQVQLPLPQAFRILPENGASNRGQGKYQFEIQASNTISIAILLNSEKLGVGYNQKQMIIVSRLDNNTDDLQVPLHIETTK